jgi:hypothetical protein
LSAAVDEAAACVSPTTKRAETRMTVLLCMKHLAVGETIPRRCASVVPLEAKTIDGIVELSNSPAALVRLVHLVSLVGVVRWPKGIQLNRINQINCVRLTVNLDPLHL